MKDDSDERFRKLIFYSVHLEINLAQWEGLSLWFEWPYKRRGLAWEGQFSSILLSHCKVTEVIKKETSGLLREGLLHYLLLYLHYFCIGAIPTNVTLSRNVLLIWHFPHLYCGIFRFTGSWWISIWKENLNSVLINNLININKTNNHF
jgi:hypothetical protein